MSRWFRGAGFAVCAVAVMTFVVVSAPASAAVAELAGAGAGLEWRPLGGHAGMVLKVSGPGGLTLRREFPAGASASLSLFDAAGQLLPDGAYNWELTAAPVVDPQVRRRLAAARRSQGDTPGQMPEGNVQAGTFRVVQGSFVIPGDRTETPRRAAEGVRNVTAEDQVIPDDLIVQGSGCFGFDCVNNESFGFDTIRLKENNTRIKFEDTSVGTFPTNDWQLTANDSASGGSSKFSIEDITGAKVPFTITAGASTNSIFVDSTGRVGFRTSTPVLDLHVSTSNTPAIRLEQTNSGGFTAQTWDIAGNEANFFVRDVTGGSKLSFRIRPGAPTSSLDIAADGDVGIGTASPDFKLHVESSDATSTGGKVLIENISGTTTAREGFEIRNNGQALFILKDTSQTPRWAIGTLGASWVVDNQANGGTELTLTNTGSMTIAGTLTQNSDRTTKTDVEAVSPSDVLGRVLALPISTWRKIGEPDTHLGPMAQDFAAAFGLGVNDRSIAPIDLGGVSIAAIQGLHAEVEEKQRQIEALQERLAAVEALLAVVAGQR
jgi:hypothetical protein